MQTLGRATHLLLGRSVSTHVSSLSSLMDLFYLLNMTYLTSIIHVHVSQVDWASFLKGYVYQTSGGYAVQGLIVAHNRLLENYILVKFCKAASQGLVALPSG